MAKLEVDSAAPLYEVPLPSDRVGPLANAFSYPTKISPESIGLFIATHTHPGETVLDVFGGSGTTGLAALLCDRPTDRMRSMAQHLGLSPEWGPRTAVVYELGVIGSFVSQVMCNPPDPDVFSEAANTLVEDLEKQCGWLYAATDPEGETGQLRHIVWSEIVVCPRCGHETTLWDAALRWAPLQMSRRFVCDNCGESVEIARCARVQETVFDALTGEQCTRRRRVPARVYGESHGRAWQRQPVATDLQLARHAEDLAPPQTAPIRQLFWGDLQRSGYHQGMSHLHHLYTSRNFYAVAEAMRRAEQYDHEVRDALKLLVLSYNATHSTLMTRVVVKKGQRDLALTGAQSGVLYVSGLPVEKNVFRGLRRKTSTISAAFAQVHGSRSTVRVVNASSTKLDLEDCSVKYVFTDPPFGDYIPYAEINQINELWLGEITDRTDEAIVSHAQGKSVDDYARLMSGVFREVGRVLADDGWATVVFHSAKAAVWDALSEAFQAGGLSVRATSVLDKAQTSFKQTASNVSVKGDPLLLLSKHPREAIPTSDTSIAELVESTLREAAAHTSPVERTKERMYSRFVARCAAAGVRSELDAATFYEFVSKSDLVSSQLVRF